MIFYFSGTGNSAWVARMLAERLNDVLTFIPDAMSQDATYILKSDEALGFVFPCYAWGVPKFVEDFILNTLCATQVSYVYYVCTCGDDTGETYKQFGSIVSQKGWKCDSAFDLIMPESYISLPGFDVDSKEKEEEKLARATEEIERIADIVGKRAVSCNSLHPGAFPWVKSHVLKPLFYKFLMSPKPFKTNDDCIGCGVCADVCPLNNILISPQSCRPQWGDNCVGCLRCYHSCSKHAVGYGCFTKGKGQYLHPQGRKNFIRKNGNRKPE